MDNEAVVAKTLKRILDHLGYSADAVEDGEKALDAYRRALESGKPYDAVIMDLTVPGGMGGKELIAQLKRIDPGVKGIVSSGYCGEAVMSEWSAHGFSDALLKPYRIEEASQTLRRVLGPGRDG